MLVFVAARTVFELARGRRVRSETGAGVVRAALYGPAHAERRRGYAARYASSSEQSESTSVLLDGDGRGSGGGDGGRGER